MIKISLPKKIPFMKIKPFFIVISLFCIAASFYLFATKGLNYGIDFRGGVKLTYNFLVPTSDGEIQSVLAADGMDAIVQRFGEEDSQRYTIKTKQTEASLEDTVAKISGTLSAKYGAENLSLDQQETVGPKVGKELRKKGYLAIFFTLVAMLVYIGIRFDFFFAPGAVISLLHDVIIVMGFLVFFDKEYNLSILAALLTIAGYSINDTIVIYDRIREHAKLISPSTINDVVDRSLNETLSRTIITSLTVLLVVVVLFIRGGGVIHDFAFCFIVGVIAGTYSSLFIASPIYVYLYRNWPKFAKVIGSKKYR